MVEFQQGQHTYMYNISISISIHSLCVKVCTVLMERPRHRSSEQHLICGQWCAGC